MDEVRQLHTSSNTTSMHLVNDGRLGLIYLLTFPFAREQLKQTGANILEVDYLDEDTIRRAALAYGDKALDILINVGGEATKFQTNCVGMKVLIIYRPGLTPHPKSWHEETADDINEKFRVMAMVPCLSHFISIVIA